VPAIKTPTRWASYLPFDLAYLARHRDFSTTRRYVHPNVETIRQAIEGYGECKRGTILGKPGINSRIWNKRLKNVSNWDLDT
jgi:hypothetical protein